MHNIILGSIIAAASVGEATAINTVIEKGTTLGTLAPAAIWAVVALVAVIGLVKLYWDKRNDEQDLKQIIKETTIAITKNTEVLDRLNDSVVNCTKR